jgi:hypothetical protein
MDTPPNTPNRITLKIADVVVSISSDRPIGPDSFGTSYRHFLASGEPEVAIDVRHEGLPPLDVRPEDTVFDSASLWTLYRTADRYVVVLRSPVYGPEPFRAAVFDGGFTRGVIYNNISLPEGAVALPADPLDYPLSEVFMVCLLGHGRGLLVHGCGVSDGGHGYLFAGNSSHGKTTTARIWKDQAQILNDDRIIVRRRDGRFWMYGTPWHGDCSLVSAARAPIDRVFFLRHCPSNEARRVERTDAATGVLTRCFPPLWDVEGMRFSLELCAELAAAVPCYDLGFTPDASIVDFVRGLH